ncbi:MAG: DUF6452 family protein [Mangrovibacterium sp.]
MKHIPGILLFLLALVSCKEVYDRPPQSQAQIYLYDATPTALSARVTVQGYQNDSVWIEDEDLTYFNLPLDQNNTEAIYILLLDSVADTLIINYNSKLVYESMESGFFTEHYIQSLRSTAHKIDSIALIDTLVISTWHENIQLFLNDSTNLSGS